jgi:hypothetical protein
MLAFGAQALPITDAELSGLTWTVTNDLLGDNAGGNGYEVYGIGHAIVGNSLYVVVRTDFNASTGAPGADSYSSNAYMDAGDLYINVGGSFQSGTGMEYGVATTSHGNNVTQAYGSWGNPVQQGRLYSYDTSASGPMFADGTYERYEYNFLGHIGTPDDGDGSLTKNSYPTMIRYGLDVAGDVSGYYFRTNTTDPWMYELFYKIDLTALNYAGETIQFAWSMECGNDAAQHFGSGEIPEPATVALLLSGVAAIASRRRRES